jgi:hypothetical protein
LGKFIKKITTVGSLMRGEKKRFFSMSGRTHRDIKSQELKIMEGMMGVWGNKDEMKGSFTKKERGY